MSASMRDELQFKVDQLSYQLEERSKKHAEAVAKLRSEARAIKKSLLSVLERATIKASEESSACDDAYIRRVEWRIPDFSTVKNTPKNEALWSVPFNIMGVSDIQLEFFPQGRDSTKLPGFCALFLWCPVGVKVRYRLRVGSHWSGPEEDEYDSKMGHGHSNFCHLESQRDEKDDSIVIGLEIMRLHHQQEPALDVRLLSAGPEAMIEREASVIRNRHMDCVEWKIKNIMQRAKDLPRGVALCSPLFSIAGIREMLLEFYPNGITPPPGAKEGREGYCGFYVRAGAGRTGSPLTLQLTLFVGGAKKGPIRVDFEGAAKGLHEFCRLEEQLDGKDLVVGVQLSNPELSGEPRELVL